MHQAEIFFLSLARLSSIAFLKYYWFHWDELDSNENRWPVYFCRTPVDTTRIERSWGRVLGFTRSPNSVALFFLSLSFSFTHTKDPSPDGGRTAAELRARVSAWPTCDCSAFKQTPRKRVGEGFVGKNRLRPHLILTSETKPPFTHCIKRVWVRIRDATWTKTRIQLALFEVPIQPPSMRLTKHARA